jgi:putative hydrolase of the HAD superfamily
LAFNTVRKKMHAEYPGAQHDFFTRQAELFAQEAHIRADEAASLIERIVYDGMKPFFERATPFKDAHDTIAAFKIAGLKIALLSDFPPEQKGSVWGILPLCDAALGSEQTGALKPSRVPFAALVSALGVPGADILYVGNSVRYDVRGARQAGLKTAYLMPFWRRILSKPLKEADISFKTYRQLREIVLE